MGRPRMRNLIVTLAFALPMMAGEAIPTRTPTPDEIGYRPADGTTVRVDPPGLIWMHEKPARTYTVQWARDAAFAQPTTVAGLRLNAYAHTAPWGAGLWHWRYRYTTADGAESAWSAVRRLTIPADAVAMPMPDRAQQKERVPAGHPRLFLRPEDVPRLRARATGDLAERFAPVRAEAERLLTAAPTPEPAHKGRNGGNAEERRYWWPNREQTIKACEEAETLAFAWLMTGDQRFGTAARERILRLAAWDPDGPTNVQLNDEAAMPILHRLPRAYDWAWDMLDEADRRTVQAAMRRRAMDVWRCWLVKEGTGHLTRPFESHANRAWHKLGEAAIACLGDVPEAADWLDFAVCKFACAYPVWSDDDGGWHEGVDYLNGYMVKIVWWLQVSRSALGIDAMRKPFFARACDFLIYQVPPGSPNAGFGDHAQILPRPGWGAWVDYFTRRALPATAARWRWWYEQWKLKPAGGVMGFLHAAEDAPVVAARPPVDLPPSTVFHGVGVASLHVDLADAGRDVHLIFKASPFGGRSHGNTPQNAFALNAYGAELLSTCTFRDYYGSPFHKEWAWSTRAHNAVLIDGKGQTPHSPAATGAIVAERLTPAWDFVAGDATTAYAGAATRALRRLLFVKPDLVVIHDDVTAPKAVPLQIMLHGPQAFTCDADAQRLEQQAGKAAARIWYAAEKPVAFRQWHGYEPAPTADKKIPDRWHVEATVPAAAHHDVFTVIAVQRPGQTRDLRCERLTGPEAMGVRVTEGDRVIATVAFRTTAGSGPTVLGDLRDDGPIAVRIPTR